jgi:hypothetical protein
VPGTVILDQRRPVQVLHDGRWLDGWLEAYRRDPSRLPHQYCVVMYRHLVMFPRLADPAVVDDLVERAAAVYRKSSGFRSVTASVDALMGPGAKAGEIGRIMEADFDTLEEALAVLKAEDFQGVKAATESLASTLFLYEHREI